jgi:glyoxylase-like metal-dependent hydrolase (beta-lactamase superfamily II)
MSLIQSFTHQQPFCCEEPVMPCHICETCGTQYENASAPPAQCAICEDERQYVGWNGQRWTTPEQLAQTHTLRIEDDEGILGLGITPGFAIPQRAMLLPTCDGNVLWECLSLVTDAAIDALNARGGVQAIVISHPHFYTAMLDWSEALGGVPIVLHEADRSWVRRSSPRIEWWSGDRKPLSDSVTLLRCGGHFPGSTALYWKDGPRQGGALFPGDALQVVFDRRHVTFMYSYPNEIPMRPSEVRRMRALLADFAFEDVYGYTWGRNIIGGARAAVDASFDRYLAAVSG